MRSAGRLSRESATSADRRRRPRCGAADIRAGKAFYNEQNVHAHTEAFFELLTGADLGFVHQVLTRTRIHPAAMTPLSVKINMFHDAWLSIYAKQLSAATLLVAWQKLRCQTESGRVEGPR